MSILLFLAVGSLIGLARGGSFRQLSVDRLRVLPLLWVIVVVQLLVNVPSNEALAFTLLIGSYVLLFAFAAINRHVVGMAVVALGALLNFIVIAVNGGMPVSIEALHAIGDPLTDAYRGKHFIDYGTAKLRFLSDIIAWRLQPRIISIGDLVILGGIALVMQDLMRAREKAPA